MAEQARIRERPEGERSHLWWDTEKHFPFLTMDRGWNFCPYCGGFMFGSAEKFMFPNLLKNSKGEDLSVPKDVGCLNFRPSKKAEIQKDPEPVKPEEPKVEEKKQEAAPPPPEEPKPKRRGILRSIKK